MVYYGNYRDWNPGGIIGGIYELAQLPAWFTKDQPQLRLGVRLFCAEHTGDYHNRYHRMRLRAANGTVTASLFLDNYHPLYRAEMSREPIQIVEGRDFHRLMAGLTITLPAVATTWPRDWRTQ